MFYKLYPFSEKNRKAIADYAEALSDKQEEAEVHGEYEEAEKLFNKFCEIGAILHQMNITTDGKVAWLYGGQLAKAKKILAMA